MLALTQTLPEAFAAEASPANARTKSKKLSAPSARSSEQGGRRRYSLTQREDGLELCLELHDQTDCWIIDKLPKTGSPATIIPAKAAGPYAPAAMDSGTVELVEGSKRKGWMHLFFSGSKLQGDWLLWQVASQWKLANKANTHDAPAMPV
jgi:hypothetical protein